MIRRADTVLVVGGGAAGISHRQELHAARSRLRVVEGQSDLGGNWFFGSSSSRVYRSTHLISSKTNSQFS